MAGVEHKSSLSPTGRCGVNGASDMGEHHRGLDVFFDCLGFEKFPVPVLFFHPPPPVNEAHAT